MLLLLMWYLTESSLITAWSNLVSTKHLRTNLPRWHISMCHAHIERVIRLWCVIWPRTDELRKDSLCFLLAHETPGCSLLFATPKHPFVHNLPARHMLLTILPPRPSASTRHAFWGGVGCQIHSRVERASFLEFVGGTWKAFAAAKASLWTSLSFATRPGRVGRQGTLNSFGRSQSISQLLNKDDRAFSWRHHIIKGTYMRPHTTVPALYPHWGSVSIARGQPIYQHSASSRKVKEYCPPFESQDHFFFKRSTFRPVNRLDLTSHDE